MVSSPPPTTAPSERSPTRPRAGSEQASLPGALERTALQVCPNDHPPFADVCRAFETTLKTLGYEPTSVFFEHRAKGPRSAWAHYVAAKQLPRFVQDARYRLVLTHRYKGYRAGLRVPCHLQISLAHEFGMFARHTRRWRARLGRRPVLFAGVSRAVSDELNRVLNRPTAVLPNPIDTQCMQAALLTRAQARADLGFKDDDFLVGVVGRLHWRKRPQLAVDGFLQAAPTLGRSAKLVFLGDGELTRSLPNQDNIRLLGFVPDAFRYLRAFDLVLSAATEGEAFGMAMVEALVADVPTVSTHAPGPQEVAGDCARFVAPTPQAIAAGLIAAQATPQTAGKGFERVQRRFGIAAVAARLAGLIDHAPSDTTP